MLLLKWYAGQFRILGTVHIDMRCHSLWLALSEKGTGFNGRNAVRLIRSFSMMKSRLMACVSRVRGDTEVFGFRAGVLWRFVRHALCLCVYS